MLSILLLLLLAAAADWVEGRGCCCCEGRCRADGTPLRRSWDLSDILHGARDKETAPVMLPLLLMGRLFGGVGPRRKFCGADDLRILIAATTLLLQVLAELKGLLHRIGARRCR